jgi:hypothetical protein
MLRKVDPLPMTTNISQSRSRRRLSRIAVPAFAVGVDSGRKFFVIAIVNVLLFVGVCLCFRLQYQTNDDVAMNLYAAGKGLGQPPSEFLLFQHFSLGLILKFLYVHLPNFPWYGAMTYLYLFVSNLTIGYVIWRVYERRSGLMLWLATFLLFYLGAIISPQFTICAGYLAIAGTLLLFATTLWPYTTTTRNVCALTIASALMILASLVRIYSLAMVLLVMLPLYGYALFRNTSATLRRLVPVVCLVFLIAVFSQWWHLAYYSRSPGWGQFYPYNDIRADFIDRRKITWNENTQRVCQQIGWSQNDLFMLASWFYVDPKVYSLHNLVFVSERASSPPRPEIAWHQLLRDLELCFLSSNGMAVLVLLVLLVTGGALMQRWFAVAALVFCSLICFGIDLIERHLPYRVWIVMLFGLYAMLLSFSAQTSKEWRRPLAMKPISWKILSCFVGICLAILCLGEIKKASEVSNDHKSLQNAFRDDIARLRPQVGQLFVIWGGDFPFVAYQLPAQAAPVTAEMQILGLGVGNQDPYVTNRLKSFGISDLYQAFYDRDDVFLICNDRKTKLLIQYIWEHYHTSVEIRTVFQGARFTVRQVRKRI